MKERTKLTKMIFVFFWFLFLPILLFAQNVSAAMLIPTFSITGQLNNEQNQVLADKTIDLFDIGNCQLSIEQCLEWSIYNSYSVQTNSQGRYSFTGMQCTDNNIIRINIDGYEEYLKKVSFPCWTTSEYNITLTAANSINPVIIIPGIMASWNAYQLNGATWTEDKWTMDPLMHTYDQLIEDLQVYGGYVLNENLFTFPYDWRVSNVNTAMLLRAKIEEIKNQTGAAQVDIVAHSMGGLVARYYIESSLYQNDIDQIIFIATPHRGSPKSYLAWESGYTGVNLRSDFIKELLIKQLAIISGYKSQFDYIHNYPITTVQELLPDYAYLINKSSGEFIPYTFESDQYPHSDLLHFLNTSENINKFTSRVNETTIIYNKNSYDTPESIVITPPLSNQAPLWEHGWPVGWNIYQRTNGINLGQGDTTVPYFSAISLPTDRVIEKMNVDHTEIVNYTSSDIIDILADKYVPITVTNQPDNYLIIQVYSPLDIQVITPHNQRIGWNFTSQQMINEIANAYYTNGTMEFMIIPNPGSGNYQIITQGTATGDYHLDVSLVDNNGMQIKTIAGETATGVMIDYDFNVIDNTLGDFISQDQTAPKIIITTPTTTTYLHSDLIKINYQVSDTESGVKFEQPYLDEMEYNQKQIDLFNYNLGNHNFTVQATDWAGNIATKQAVFEIIANFDSLKKDINRLYLTGDIKNQHVKQILLKQVKVMEKWYNKIKYLEQERKFPAKQRLIDKFRNKWLKYFSNKYLQVWQRTGLITVKAKQILTEQFNYIVNHL